MAKVFITGATGLIGSTICELLRNDGDEVVGLVRPGSDASALEALGVQVARGDVTDPTSIRAAADGCEAAIHCAALLGGPTQDASQFEAVNVQGAINVYDAALELGLRRVVAFSTTTFFDFKDQPLTEHSPVDPDAPGDPYTVTKRRAFEEAMRRAGEGEDIVVVIPGGTYGPAPQVERSMEPPSFNLRIVWALHKEVDSYVHFPVPWAYTEDVARCAIKAMHKGVRGERYLAFGQPGDVTGIAGFMNMACDIAGIDHRVEAVTGAALDDPAQLERFGPTLIALGKQQFPDPFFVNDLTTQRLDYAPVSLEDGMRRTVDWLYAHKLV
jgi:dihydroflavonol-4-reductase